MKLYEATKLREELARAFPEGKVQPAHTIYGHFYRIDGREDVAPSVTTVQSIQSKEYLKQWAVNKAIEHIIDHLTDLCAGNKSVLEDAKYAHKRELDFAGSVGTTAHDAAERYIKHWLATGEKKESAVEFLGANALPEEIAGAASFTLFTKEKELVPIASEAQVYYIKGEDCFAGTVDSVFLVGEVYKDREGSPTCKHDYSRQKGDREWCVLCGRTIDWRLTLVDYKTSNTVAGKNEYASQVTAYAHAIEQRTGWKFDDLIIVQLNKQRAKYDIYRITNRKMAWKRFLATLRLYVEVNRGEDLLEPVNKKLVIRI